MAKATLSSEVMQEVFKAAPHLLKFPAHRLWIDYDEEVDMLYISFDRPQNASDSQMLENGVVLRYKDDKIVGITILDASAR